jgi:hypothetical protein
MGSRIMRAALLVEVVVGLAWRGVNVARFPGVAVLSR